MLLPLFDARRLAAALTTLAALAGLLGGAGPALAAAGDDCAVRWQISPLAQPDSDRGADTSSGANPLASTGAGASASASASASANANASADTDGNKPPAWQLSLQFDAAGRSSTRLRLPDAAGALQALPDSPALQPLPDDPALRQVVHASSGPVTLRWRISDTARHPGLRVGARWLVFTGQALLPLPEWPSPATTKASAGCVAVNGLAEGSRFISSLGHGQGRQWLWAPGSDAAAVRQNLFAAGDLPTQTRQADGQPLLLAMPADAAGPPPGAPLAQGLANGSANGSTTVSTKGSVNGSANGSANGAANGQATALADAVASVAAAQRRFWRDADAAPLTVLALPGPSGSAPEAATLGQLLLLQWPAQGTLPDSRLDEALTEALLRQRLPLRLGPMVHAGRQDEALRAWLGEGLVAFYTHRLLLRQGAWTVDDYAAALNRRIGQYLDSPELAADNLRVATGWAANPALAALPAARGEWLALHWHAALRAAGQPGLDGVLRKLMLPLAQARPEGPLSAPLASHRLLAALRASLGDAPLRELTRWVDQGQPFTFRPGTLGPCFRMAMVPRSDWRLGFDPASLASGVLQGVEPDGPAAAAGLRDGLRVASHSVLAGDVSQPVQLQVIDDDGSRRSVRYSPIGPGPSRGEWPRYSPVPDALQQPACQGWLSGDGRGSDDALRADKAAAADEPGAQALAAAHPPRLAAGAKAGRSGKSAQLAKSGKAGKAGKTGKAASSGKGGKPGKAVGAGRPGAKANQAAAGEGKGKGKPARPAAAKARH